MSDSLLVSSLGRFQVVKYIVMTLDQAAVIDHIAAVQTLKDKFTPEWPFIFFTPIKSFYKIHICAAPCFSNRASRDTKKPFTFLSFQTGILTNKSHFKETRSLKYLNFPAKLQAELFVVTHTLLAPRWRRSVVEFWATLEKDFVGI